MMDVKEPALMTVRKGVFPAAGLGTRFLPATKAQPKEMLPLVDKPMIQYVVEEAVASGLSEIIIVTGRGKRAIEDHFDAAFELEYYLNDRGKVEELAQIKTISELASVSYVRQKEPLGLGHAILCARALVEKPRAEDAPSDLAIIGRYVLTPDLFEILAKTAADKRGEIQLTDGLRTLRKRRPMYAVEFVGKRYDTGDKLGFLKATVEFALARPDLSDAFRAYLKGLDF